MPSAEEKRIFISSPISVEDVDVQTIVNFILPVAFDSITDIGSN